MDNIQFYGVFCDDIRHEIGNKFTLVGCYGKELYIQELPSKLNKLCVHFCIQSRGYEEVIERIRVEVLVNNKVSNSLEFDVEYKEQQESEDLSLNGGFELPSLDIEEGMTIELQAKINDVAFHGAKLTIKKHPQDMPNIKNQSNVSA